MTNTDVTIIIPNFNGRDLLEKNLPEVIKCFKNTEIIVVDDASTDGSVKLLQTNYPKVKIISRKSNAGFATAVNDGVAAAGSDFVFLLNHDVVPEKNTLELLLHHFDDPNVFAVGCMERSVEGTKTVLRGRGIGKFERGFLLHKRGEVDKTDTLWVSGGAGIFRKDIWMKLNGMDELYSPFYWEDIDLSYRALKAGYKIIFEPKAIVTHRHEEGIIRREFTKKRIEKIAYRNQILFVWLNITSSKYLWEHILFLPYHIINSLINLHTAFLKGFIKAFFLLPKVLKHRGRNKKLTRQRDEDLL
jgi:GT2 family glycosyltransferase